MENSPIDLRQDLRGKLEGHAYLLEHTRSSPELLKLAHEAIPLLKAAAKELKDVAANDPRLLRALGLFFISQQKQTLIKGRDYIVVDFAVNDEVNRVLRELFNVPE